MMHDMDAKCFGSIARRGFLTSSAVGALLLCLPACASTASRKGALPARWPDVVPPNPPRIAHPIVQLGRTRDDPYSWMKFIPASGTRDVANLPDIVREELLAENEYATKILAPLQAERDRLLEQMLARASDGVATPPITYDGWEYFTGVPPGSVHPLHSRRKPGGETEVLVDDALRAKGHAYYRSTDHQPSPDHRYFAWAEDVIGNDRHRIVVRDNATGNQHTLVDKDAYGYGALAFSPSSKWLFWIWRDAFNRPTRLYRTAVDGSETALVYEETDPALFMGLKRTAADGFLALTMSGPEMSEVRLVAAADETGTPLVVQPRQPGVLYEIEEWDGSLVSLTNADGAFDQKIERLDSKTFAPVQTLVPHRAGEPILAVMPFAQGLVRLQRVNGLQQLVILHRDGRELPVSFDDAAYAIEVPGPQSYSAGTVTIIHQSPKSPRRWIRVGLKDASKDVLLQERLTGFDPDDYEIERLFAPAPDGETVPITLLSRRGQPRDGSVPLLLYGYGAYGVSSEPEFSLPATVLIDQGWRYAIAHVRGGSEKGRQWFLGGRKFTKRNSFTDFVACAEHLCAKGYTAPKRIAAYGLSAGGLLVGASMNIKPDIWAGVIAKVPFVDMLNTMSDADHPLVPLFRPDWGDPLADPEAYDYIASISPYENVRRASYPPLLCTAGLKDDRVSYWEPAKLVAQVRSLSTSGNPALLLTDMYSGHQGSADLRSEFEEMALFWAFARHCVNVAS